MGEFDKYKDREKIINHCIAVVTEKMDAADEREKQIRGEIVESIRSLKTIYVK